MSGDFPITIKTLLEQCGGNKAIGEVILDEFLVQIDTDTREIEECLASGNIVQAGRVGHRLKGTAGVLGAVKLHALCFDLETAGKAGNATEAAQVYISLKAEADRCVAAVPEAKTHL